MNKEIPREFNLRQKTHNKRELPFLEQGDIRYYTFALLNSSKGIHNPHENGGILFHFVSFPVLSYFRATKDFMMSPMKVPLPLYVYRVVEYHTKCLQHLATFSYTYLMRVFQNYAWNFNFSHFWTTHLHLHLSWSSNYYFCWPWISVGLKLINSKSVHYNSDKIC